MLRFAISSLGGNCYESDRISDNAKTLKDAEKEVAENLGLGDDDASVVVIINICEENGQTPLNGEDFEKVYESLKPVLDILGKQFNFNFIDTLVEQSFRAGCDYVRHKIDGLLSDE